MPAVCLVGTADTKRQIWMRWVLPLKLTFYKEKPTWKPIMAIPAREEGGTSTLRGRWAHLANLVSIGDECCNYWGNSVSCQRAKPHKKWAQHLNVFSSNPIPPEKTFLKDLEANNLYPLRHSLKKKWNKNHRANCTTGISQKAIVSHCLCIYFVHVMYWYAYVSIHIYLGS